jgi:hypothetical protein
MRALIIRARLVSFSVLFSDARHMPESTAPSVPAAVICMNEDISPPSESFLPPSLPLVVSFVWGATAAPRSGSVAISTDPVAVDPPTAPNSNSDTTAIVRTVPMLDRPSVPL